MICVFIFKGLWTFFDIIYTKSTHGLALIILASLLIYIILNYKQNSLLKNYEIFNSNLELYKGAFLLNLVSLLTYLSSISIWFTLWKTYERFVLNTNHQYFIFLATHFFIAFCLIAFNTSSLLYGFSRIKNENERSKLFKINYLSKILC